jgi:hypothetical protein
MSIDGVAHCLRIEEVSGHDPKPIAWFQRFGVAHERSHRVTALQCASNQQPSNTTSGTKYDQLHPAFRGAVTSKGSLYRAGT